MDMGAKSVNDPAGPSPEAPVHREGEHVDTEHVDRVHVDREHLDKAHVDIEHLHEHEHIRNEAMEAARRGQQRITKNVGKIPGTRIFSK
ncbi:hypothetical protein [Terriglobus albidus]|uniref:hypothetical protein n=1 Tax=Terriglobus albidus TaxID=1592106 RepID=UPI0021E0BD20|nr:hypothetical protein [Terriglobus albidus]